MLWDHGPVFPFLVTFGPALVIGAIAVALAIRRERRRK